MVLSDEKKREYIKRIILSRMRLLCNNGFYGLLLMHMDFALDENCQTAATDGHKIFFGPNFLDELNDSELDFIMMHEILHCVLQHCKRTGDRNNELYNIACDIVVNSNIKLSNNNNDRSITLRKYGVSMHIAPDGKEGAEYTAEQVYDMLSPNSASAGGSSSSQTAKGDNETDCNTPSQLSGSSIGREQKKQAKNGAIDPIWDDHTHWGFESDDDEFRDVWVKRLVDAGTAISIRDPSNQRGTLPLCVERILKELKSPQTDWRMVLNDFVQEEIADYSFTPPDRRFDDNPFYLPDFNDTVDVVNNILFMIDTSGSMSDDMITSAYSEVKGAIDQFDGKLCGWLGFFDAAVVEPIRFEDVEEFKVIKPAGGGGTSFHVVFEYVHRYMSDDPPVSIIILTDGFAPFPKEKMAMGIPVLWVLNSDVEPPWGKVARITV